MTTNPRRIPRQFREVKIGNERLLLSGLGPQTKVLCEDHSYVEPDWVLLPDGRRTCVCHACIIQHCQIGEAKYVGVGPRASREREVRGVPERAPDAGD